MSSPVAMPVSVWNHAAMSKRENLIATSLSLLLFAFATGCAKGPNRQKTDAFFVDWFKSHGETNVVVDAAGVGIAGNPTRLRASLYGMKKGADGGFTAEMEFRVRLPAKGEIIEYVAGMGKTEEHAIKDSELNFLLTTFHVVYRSFINAADPHQEVHQVTVNGTKREMMMGDIYATHRGPRGYLQTTALTAAALDQDCVRARARQNADPFGGTRQ